MTTQPEPFTLDAATARVHAGEYLLLSALEAGLAEGYDRARQHVVDHRAPLYRSLDLAAVGARRRAGHYAHLARTMSAYAQADTDDRAAMLAGVTLDLTDVHDGPGGRRDH